ncbi:glycosyltransferase [Catenuloplanes sp. NPDC051500]|uniref:glycosyltransferase n=1 Tax=Catenuloplanes sp. NPDC051500 TaxID=3363959 RepID=UPI003798F2D3
MDATVIIPARNAAHLLPVQLAALARQDFPGDWEVVVVDNGSADDTAGVVRDWADRLPALRVVRHETPGINGARNAGARHATGDLIAFCDADDAATPGWLTALCAADADIAGGYLDPEPLNSARTRDSRPANPPDRLPRIMGWLPYATGASMAVRAGVLRALGGFDESWTGGGGDDVELCLRAQLAGHSIAFAPGAVVHYRLRHGLRPLFTQQMGYGRADARVYRDFRAHGLTVNSTREAAREWLTILAGAHALADRDRAGRWVCEAGWRIGRLRGSVAHRVWCP